MRDDRPGLGGVFEGIVRGNLVERRSLRQVDDVEHGAGINALVRQELSQLGHARRARVERALAHGTRQQLEDQADEARAVLGGHGLQSREQADSDGFLDDRLLACLEGPCKVCA